MSFDYAALERRVAALEAAQPASLRIGRVTGVNGGKARVEFGDGQNMNSYEIPALQKRVKRDQDIKMPDIGEPVAALFAGNGREQGVILGAYYNGEENDPGQASEMDYSRYEDGTEIWYDRTNHKLAAKVNGEVVVEAQKTASVKAKEDIRAESESRITIKAPVIELRGVLSIADMDGEATTATLRGNYNVIEGDITAESVSLRRHCHENSGGEGIGGRPLGG